MTARAFLALLLVCVSSFVCLCAQTMVEYSILTGASGSAATAAEGVGKSIGGVFDSLHQIQSSATSSDSPRSWTPGPRRALSLGGPDLLELSPREAKILMGLRIGQLLDSPLGQEIERQLRASSPEFQEWFQRTESDPISRIEEIIIASHGGQKNPPLLMVVRCDCDEQIRGMVANSEGVSRQQIAGTTVFMRPPKPDSPVQGLAFLDSTTAVAGDLDSLQRYLHDPPTAGSPGDLQAAANSARGSYDLWIVADSPGDSLPGRPPEKDAATVNPWSSVTTISGGIRFGPDIEVGAELLTTSHEDATQLITALRTVGAFFTQGATDENREAMARLMAAVALTQDGPRIRLSLRVPESEVVAALRRQTSGGDVQIHGGTSAGGARSTDEVLTIHASPRDGGTRVIRLSDIKAP